MTYDTIVIGSGFGGAMAALPLVRAGERVLMLERGGWVPRGPENWTHEGVGLVSEHYTRESAYDVTTGRRRYRAGMWSCVGGQSVFYGGASYRFRESDFAPKPHVDGESHAEWPISYQELEPYYSTAEELLGIVGEPSPTDPQRSTPFPFASGPLPQSSQRLASAASRLGLTPSRIPLAITFDGNANGNACMRCGTCDGYACAVGAKNDLATGILPQLIREGMTLRANTVCVRLVRNGARITAVDYVDRTTGARGTFEAKRVVLAAGTLATPHLLLASNLGRVNPAEHAVGRYLTRHNNAVIVGLFARKPNPQGVFDKHVAILDLYEQAGSIQQMTPVPGVVRAYLPFGLRTAGAVISSHVLGLIVIAEDQPRHENGVAVDWSRTDRFGLPQLAVNHTFSAGDQAASKLLMRTTKAILREAGARLTLTQHIESFTHGMGTVRMGNDASTAPLDRDGRYRGLDNLFVTDASVFPRSGGLNPSLTIAANALRVASALASTTPVQRGRTLRTLAPALPDSPTNQ